MNQNLCNNCGGDYEYRYGRWICRACGAYRPEDISNEEVTLLYTASQKLRLADFDEAEREFDDILRKYPQNPSGYWGRLMARYGIKYEEDYDGRMLPTCYAPSIESLSEDSDYTKALKYANREMQSYFIGQVGYMERVRREWLEKASREKPYDIFICYKDSDLANGIERTEDSIAAQEIYVHLLEQGYRVFYSRESLRSKVGEKYEPYIFNALSTAKVMLVYGSKPEYVTSTWLKNEWTRYEMRIKNGEKKPNSLLVACDGFSPNELPKALSSRQCFNAGQRSFYGDLDAAIARILKKETPASASQRSPAPRRKAVPIVAVCATVAVVAMTAVVALGMIMGQKEPVPSVDVPLTTEAMITQAPNGLDTEPQSDTDAPKEPNVADTMFSETVIETQTEEITPETTACVHVVTIDPAVPATCTATGLSAGSHCSTCGVVIVPQSYLAPQGHTYSNGFCTVCGVEELLLEDIFAFEKLIDGTYSIVARDPSNVIGHVSIPNAYNGKPITVIGDRAFYECHHMTSIQLPDSITRIGTEAFQECIELTNLTIPHGVTHIGEAAFVGCTTLVSIDLPNSLISLGDRVFQRCTSLTSISIPNGVKQLGVMLFYYCTNLQNVTIPDSVVSFGGETFNNCISLTSITIPDNVTSLGIGTFEGCTWLTSVNIPSKVTVIGDRLFSNCSSLSSIHIPDGITRIGSEAFSNCSGLVSIEIPNSVTAIGNGTFRGCNQLTSVDIPDSVKIIGFEAFYNCKSLLSIALPQELNAIDYGTFQKCASLTSIEIPEGVLNIGDCAFEECDQLTNIMMPASLKKISNKAFSNCGALSSVRFTGTEEQWNAITKENDWDENSGAYTVHFNYTP